jgi:hypothetical protein
MIEYFDKIKLENDYDEDVKLLGSKCDDNSFSCYGEDYNYYYTFIDEDCNEIYVLEFHEYEEAGYHNYIYLDFKKTLKNILSIATDYFISESRETEDENINKMINDLKQEGYHDVECGRTYVCDLKLYKLQIFQ